MKNVTTATLAKYIGVSQPFIVQIKQGSRRFSPKKAREISLMTGLPLERLLFAEGHEIYRSLSLAYSYHEQEHAKEKQA